MPIPPSRPHEEAVIEELRAYPRYAAKYLNAVLEDGDPQELMRALHRMVQAFGRAPGVAEAAQLQAKALYDTLSQPGNPELKSLSALPGAMGMRLTVRPVERGAAKQGGAS